jgi:uracil-DNA glycosylase
LEAYNESYPNSFNTDLLDGKLGCWASQGVLLLNAYLTVEHGKPGSHKSYWELFTKRLVKLLKEHDESLCIVTVGKPASDLVAGEYSNVLRLEHPAYAARQGRVWDYQDFFKKVNDKLASLNKQIIEW